MRSLRRSFITVPAFHQHHRHMDRRVKSWSATNGQFPGCVEAWTLLDRPVNYTADRQLVGLVQWSHCAFFVVCSRLR